VDEVATAIGQYNLDGTCEAIAYTYTISGPGRAGQKSKTNENAGRDLFARVTGGPQSSSNNGRLRNGDSAQDQGFSFKGAGRDEPGFSILGASSNNDKNRERGANLARELFPHRAGAPNGGKDLFDGRIKGKARKRAEDLI
jgi:hypothetical protein